MQVVRPSACGVGEPCLDRGHVVLARARRLGADDDVEPGQHRLRNAGDQLDALAAERVEQDLLDPVPDVGVVPLERHVDEAREETPERVAPDEQPHAPPLAQMQDRDRRVVELILGDLEELVARIRLEDLDQRLVVVPAGREAAPCDDALAFLPHDGDLPRRHAVCGVGVQPEEPHFARDCAVRVEALHADVVEICGAVYRRAGVRLRQVEKVRLAGQPAHRRRQPLEAVRNGLLLLLAQDPEPRAGDGRQDVVAVDGA